MIRAVLAAVGLFFVMLAFMATTPPGGVSDEPDYYVKAMAAGHGQVVGTRVPLPIERTEDFWLPPVNHMFQTMPVPLASVRQYTIPGDRDPRPMGCTLLDTQAPATCLEASPRTPPPATETMVSSVGSYQPFVFVPTGLVMRLGWNADSALYLGRALLGLIAFLLVGGSILVVWATWRRPVALFGLLLSLTPAALVMLTGLQSSGPEDAAAIAWWVALLAVTERRPGRGAWLLALGAGVVLGCARSTSLPYLFAIAATVLLGVRGPRQSWLALHRGGRPAAAAVGATALSCLAGGIWQVLEQPHLAATVTDEPLLGSLGKVADMLYAAVGSWGWGEASAPFWTVSLWWAGLATLFALACAAAWRTHRRGLATLLGWMGFCFGFILCIVVYGEQFGVVQSRWFVPLLVGMPLLCGFLAAQETRELPRRVAPVVGAAVMVSGLGLVTMWWFEAQRYAIGGGHPLLWFQANPAWSPPLGWWPWTAALVAGALCLTASAMPVARTAGTRVRDAARAGELPGTQRGDVQPDGGSA